MAGSAYAANATKAMIQFHLRAGVRLSLRALAPLLVAVVAAIGLEQDPASIVTSLVQGLFGAPGSPTVKGACLLISLAIASWAAPRLTRGVSGWLRHLPADGTSHRRAVAVALMAAQAPVTAMGLILLVLAPYAGQTISFWRMAAGAAGLVLLAAGSSLAVLAVRGGLLPRVLGVIAAVCGVTSSWTLMAFGAALLAAADRLAGPMRIFRAAPILPGGDATGGPAGILRANLSIAGRAVGWLTLGPVSVSLLVSAGGYVMIANNSLGPAASGRAARLAGGLAVTFLLSGLADLLALRRPAWPWARSLPMSSGQRILIDAAMLFAVSLVPALLAAGIDAIAALVCIPLAALLSVRSAGMMRSETGSRAGVGVRIFMEGFALSGLVCLVPWLTLLMLGALAPAWRRAAHHDRRQKVTRWMEFWNDAAGDPLSERGR